MFRRHGFTILMFAAITGLSWGSRALNHAQEQALVQGGRELTETDALLRRDLLEFLDQVANYQGYYRSLYGHYTQVLGKLGISIPPELAHVYDVRVEEATADRFLIVAVSENQGRVSDFVSLDQQGRIHSNFRVPAPRREFLAQHAERQIRQLVQLGEQGRFREKGVFRGYFDYELKRNSENQLVGFARGVREPVRGLEVESLSGPIPLSSPMPRRTGQNGSGVAGTLQEVQLAQKIFHGETGRYATSWDELSRIANFRFEGHESLVSESRIPPFGDQESPIEIEAIQPSRAPALNVESERSSAFLAPLVIEPL